MSSQPALTQGSTLAGRYTIGERIATTGVAESYQATDTTSGNTVVVKVLMPEFAQDQEFVSTYVEEAKTAAKLQNAHIASVIDSGIEGSSAYVVTEFVAGQPLEKALAEFGKLEPQRATEIADHVASALTYAHAQGIVHRDLKPSNVMLTQDGQLKVLDFGVARMAHPKTAGQTAAVLGSGAYISPEQARGEEGGKEGDVYSLGVILYQMFAGKPPFAGDSPVAVAFQHVRETPSAPNSIGANAPAAIETLNMKMLAKAPAERPTAEEVHTELRRSLSAEAAAETAVADEKDAGQIIPQGVGSPTMVFGPKSGFGGGGSDASRRKWIIAGVVAAVVLLAAAFFFVLRSNTITVPDVTGRQIAAAKLQLEALGLTVSTIEHTGAAEADGTVLQQIPGANSAVVKGTTVTLTIAKSVTTVTVPNVVGVARSQAEATLSGAGLTPGSVTEETDSSVAPGTVITQDPAAGTSVGGGTPVNMVIAAENATASVTDVTCVPVNLAATQLGQAGLQMTVVGTEANDLCPDTGGPRVSRQDPAGDETVPSGSVIKVWTTLPIPSAAPSASGSPKPLASPPSNGSGKPKGSAP